MAMLNNQMVYLTGVHPLLEVWRDEMLAMLASLSHTTGSASTVPGLVLLLLLGESKGVGKCWEDEHDEFPSCVIVMVGNNYGTTNEEIAIFFGASI